MHSFNKYRDHISPHYLVHARSWDFKSLGLPGGESTLEACDTNRMLLVSFVLLGFCLSYISTYIPRSLYMCSHSANANIIRFDFSSCLGSEATRTDLGLMHQLMDPLGSSEGELGKFGYD